MKLSSFDFLMIRFPAWSKSDFLLFTLGTPLPLPRVDFRRNSSNEGTRKLGGNEDLGWVSNTVSLTTVHFDSVDLAAEGIVPKNCFWRFTQTNELLRMCMFIYHMIKGLS